MSTTPDVNSHSEFSDTNSHSYLQNELRQILPEANLIKTVLPLVPEISLYLLDGSYPQQDLNASQLAKIMDYPAYWSFCWASGQVMARYILDNPALVAGKCVMDFGCGSGVVAIAAAMAGAASVIACDLDNDALKVSQLNADLNNTSISLLDDLHKNTQKVDLLLAADVLYDKSNISMLDTLVSVSAQFLLADSRVKNFNYPGFKKLTSLRSHTMPDLAESEEFSEVSLYFFSQ